MPISSTDILFKYASPTGPGNSTAFGGTPGTSVGAFVSTTVVPDATLDNLFPDVTGDENAASNVDYQVFFVHNNHATLTLQSAKVWVSADVTGGATAAIATDNLGPVAKGSSSAQSAVIASKDVAPTGVSAFSAPTSKAAGLSLGSIAPGQVRAIWVRRTATNSAALNNDGLTVRVEGDTAA